MSRLPALKAREVVRALEKAGYEVDRVTGSHYILRHPGKPGRRVTVPYHGNRDIKRAVLRSIIREAGLSVEEFLRLLRE